MNNFITIESSIYLDTRLTSTDILIYGIICGLSKNDNRECFANNAFLADKRNLSKRQVQRSLNKLSNLNYITIFYRKNKRVIKTFINVQISGRDRMNDLNNNKIDVFDYDWINED